MTEMVERVAKSLYVQSGMTYSDKKYWDDMARAAIEAMREPTNEMKEIEGVHWGYGCHVCGGLQEGWYAMIDEALK